MTAMKHGFRTIPVKFIFPTKAVFAKNENFDSNDKTDAYHHI